MLNELSETETLSEVPLLTRPLRILMLLEPSTATFELLPGRVTKLKEPALTRPPRTMTLVLKLVPMMVTFRVSEFETRPCRATEGLLTCMPAVVLTCIGIWPGAMAVPPGKAFVNRSFLSVRLSLLLKCIGAVFDVLKPLNYRLWIARWSFVFVCSVRSSELIRARLMYSRVPKLRLSAAGIELTRAKLLTATGAATLGSGDSSRTFRSL